MKKRALFALISGLLLFLPIDSALADNVYIIGNIGAGPDLFVMNSSNGASTQIGSGYGGSFTNVLGQAFNPGGTLYAINTSPSSQLLTVNTSTGTGTAVGSPTGIAGLNSLEFTPDGTLYGASVKTNSLYTINPVTGAATLIGSLGFNSVMDLAWDPFNGINGTMYAIASSGAPSTNSFLYSINLMTGAGTLVSTVTADNCLMSLAVDSANRFLATDFCVQNSPLFQIDLSTGNLTNLGNTGIAASMGSAIAPTPEPLTALTLGTGLAVTWLRKKRHTRN